MAVHKFKKSAFNKRKYCVNCGLVVKVGEKGTDKECAPVKHRYGKAFNQRY